MGKCQDCDLPLFTQIGEPCPKCRADDWYSWNESRIQEGGKPFEELYKEDSLTWDYPEDHEEFQKKFPAASAVLKKLAREEEAARSWGSLEVLTSSGSDSLVTPREAQTEEAGSSRPPALRLIRGGGGSSGRP